MNENSLKNLILFKDGESGNPKGKPKGRKSLATIIRELEEEEFDWSLFPAKGNRELEKLIEQLGPIGSPFRAIIYKAVLDAIAGKSTEKAAAREWLRKAGYGDKLDLTSKGERIKQEPVIISAITPRNVVPQTENEIPGEE